MIYQAKLILVIICLSVLSACGSGGGGTDATKTTEVVIPSSSFYEEGRTFKVGEIVSIESEQPFQDGISITALDENGREYDLVGKSDGDAALILPTDIEPGTHTINFKRGNTNSILTIVVENTEFPADSEIYLDDFSDKLIDSIFNMEFSGSVDDQQSKDKLLADIEAFKAELPNLSDKEIQTLSRFMYSNLDGLITNESTASNYKIAASPQCPASIISLIISVKLTYDAVTAASAPFIPVQARALIGAGAVVAAGASVASALLVQSQCIDRIARIINRFINNTEINSMSIRTTEGALHLPYSAIKYTQAATEESAITFYDGDTKPISVIAEYELSSEALSAIRNFQGIISSIESIVPKSLLTKIQNLDKPIERDISSEVILQQIRSGAVRCNGTTSGYTCYFPEGNQIHDQQVDFTYTVSHADAESPFIKSGIVAPRDAPIVQNQSFRVIPGPGEVNRVVILVDEDVNSSNYEFTKVLGFQLVSGPTHGVIRNEFNDFGVLDYAADIIDNMPTQATLEVRVWNKYGYSDVATITLNFEEEDSDFTKISATGEDLPSSATEWSCVRDNVTGYVWEVKTAPGTGLHASEHRYRWGGIGAQQVGTLFFDDWNVLVFGSLGLCGFNDWRVPSKAELLSVTYNRSGGFEPRAKFFPYRIGSWATDNSTFDYNNYGEYRYAFIIELVKANPYVEQFSAHKEQRWAVRLVRGGQ